VTELIVTINSSVPSAQTRYPFANYDAHNPQRATRTYCTTSRPGLIHTSLLDIILTTSRHRQ